jgi:Fur family iron response transcriptional regulator
MVDCPLARVRDNLRAAGLRPTRQRVSLAWLLFGKGDRHVTAEMLFDEATRARVPMTLATVYNTLNQLTEAGLLRQIGIDGRKTYFDTNTSDHYHYLIDEETLVDIQDITMTVDGSCDVPDGYEIARVDVVVRLRNIEYGEF